jgi:hypothetical protein
MELMQFSPTGPFIPSVQLLPGLEVIIQLLFSCFNITSFCVLIGTKLILNISLPCLRSHLKPMAHTDYLVVERSVKDVFHC